MLNLHPSSRCSWQRSDVETSALATNRRRRPLLDEEAKWACSTPSRATFPIPTTAPTEWQRKHMALKGYALDRLLVEITLGPDVDGELPTYGEAYKASADVPIVRGEPPEPRMGTGSSASSA